LARDGTGSPADAFCEKEKARKIPSLARQNFDQAVSSDVAIDGFGDLVFRYRANDLLDHLPILEN
jgi:hypothetical protein